MRHILHVSSHHNTRLAHVYHITERCCSPLSRVVVVISNLYLQWIVLAAGLGVLIIVDFMFLSEDTFVYDPSYKSWGIKTGQQV